MNGGGLRIKSGSEATLPDGFLIGSAEDPKAATGCTALICRDGAIAGVSVRGAAPATIETDLLDPQKTVQKINCVMLSGGSAFGLEAASGAMRWLAEQGCGFSVGAVKVPIVCGASIFDLSVGVDAVGAGDVDAVDMDSVAGSDSGSGGDVVASAGADGIDAVDVGSDASLKSTNVAHNFHIKHPDKAMGYRACEHSSLNITTGNVGAGTGASVGKLLGESLAMKSGLGAASIVLGDLEICAIVVVNAVGSVFNKDQGSVLAGVRDPKASGRTINPKLALQMLMAAHSNTDSAEPQDDESRNAPQKNTTIGCVLSNAKINKVQATRIADMAHDGLARAIDPIHTGFDGDAIFAMSFGHIDADVEILGILSAWVTEAAVRDAVLSARSAYGLPSASDLQKG